MADDIKNFAYTDVVGNGQAVDATSITVIDASKLPTAPFNAIWWNISDHADFNEDPHVEIVRVTVSNTTTNALTITRAQEGTTATAKTAGGRYRIAAVPTAYTFETDIVGEDAVKAIGSEIDTGTNDTKFATAKAIADSKVVKAVASGYRIVASQAPLALDGSNPTSAAHGLTTCVAAFAVLTGSAAPGVSTCLVTVVINGANLDFYGWKPTSNANPTLVASTGTESFNWFAIGT